MQRIKRKEPITRLKHKRSVTVMLFWLRGITELLLFAPLWLVPAVYGLGTLQSQLLWLLQLPVLILLGSALAYAIRHTSLRWTLAIIVGAIELVLLSPADWWQGLLLAAGGAAGMLRGMAVTCAESRSSDTQRYGIGLAAYMFSGLICSRLQEWSVYMPWLTASGVVSLAIALFTWNRRQLQHEMLSAEERAVPAAARGHNRLMVAAVLVASIGVTLLTSSELGRMLLALLRSFLGMVVSTPPQQPIQAAPAPIRPPEPLAPHEPSWLATALDVLFYIVSTTAMAAAVFLLARSIYRRRGEIARFVSRFFVRLTALLGRTSRPSDEAGYVDEDTAIWSWELVERAVERRWRRFAGGSGRVRWSELRSNRERVRHLYRQWLDGLREAGYTAPSHLTPDEIRRTAVEWGKEAASSRRRSQSDDSEHDEQLIEMYYQVRYGDSDIDGTDIERLRKKMTFRR